MQAQRKTSQSHSPASLDLPTSEAVPAPPFADVAEASTALAIPSPAHALQQQVHSAFAAPLTQDRWSPRRTIAFLLFTCGAFWGGVIWGLMQLFI